MSPADYDGLPFDVLLAKRLEIDDAIRRRSAELYRLRASLDAVAASLGMHGEHPEPAATRPEAPARFRNPANPDETWSGRGKQPRWIKDLIALGHDRDEFLIGNGEAAGDAGSLDEVSPQGLNRPAAP